MNGRGDEMAVRMFHERRERRSLDGLGPTDMESFGEVRRDLLLHQSHLRGVVYQSGYRGDAAI